MLTSGEISSAVELQKARALFRGGKREQAVNTMRAWADSISEQEINGLISGAIPVDINEGEVSYEIAIP